MQKFFSLVLALVATTTLAFAATEKTVNCGGSATITATPQTGYHFVKWNDDVTTNPRLVENIQADVTYTATFAINTYTIRFLNGEDVLQSGTVEHNQTPSYTGATPTKASTAQYDYSFNGWSPAVVAATQDQDYVAQFTPVLRSYTITFKNGDEVLQSGLVAYGTVPTAPADPTKASTAQYDYTFAGWDSEIVAVTGEKTYNATFTPVLRSYTITFKNGDQVLQSGSVAYGETPVYTGATPTKAKDDQYTYTFAGWDSDIVAVTGEKTYNATFSTTTNTYTITFKNYDGTTLQTLTDVAYGETPVYTGATPTKPSDELHNYTFNTWSPAIASVTGDATYTATFNTVDKVFYTLTVQSNDTDFGTVTGSGSYEAGTSVQVTATPTDCHRFVSWSDGGAQTHNVTVDAAKTITATFEVITYTVTVLSADENMGTVTVQ